MVNCAFCKKIQYKLDNGIPFSDDLKISSYEGYKKTFNVKEAVAICRRFNLCVVHMKTIKKDNKLRISLGQDIPNNLDLVKKMVRSDI